MGYKSEENLRFSSLDYFITKYCRKTEKRVITFVWRQRTVKCALYLIHRIKYIHKIPFLPRISLFPAHNIPFSWGKCIPGIKFHVNSLQSLFRLEQILVQREG